MNYVFYVVLANSDNQPFEIEVSDSISLSKFKEVIKTKFTPILDTVTSAALTLKSSDGNIILPNEFLNYAINHNSYINPFFIEVQQKQAEMNYIFYVVLANSDNQPFEIEASDSISLSKFKEVIKTKFTPILDTVASAALTLKSSDGNIILPNEFLNYAINHNSYINPFFIEVTWSSNTFNTTAFEITKGIKPIWIKSIESYPALSLNKMSQFFEIPAKYSKIAKLLCCKSKFVLFRRQNFQKQFEFIEKEVIEKSMVGWILGPPGTGKSSAAFAFITTLDKIEWTVTWLCCSDNDLQLYCIQFTGDCVWTCEVNNSSESIRDILCKTIPTKKHLFILDGYTSTGKNNSEIMSTCRKWAKHCVFPGKIERRLLIVSSMPARGKRKVDSDYKNGVREFFVYSWSLQEYLMAVKNDNLLKNFNNYSNDITNSNEDEILSLEDLVKSKFYYAGGNFRFMFTSSIVDVKIQIEESINECDDISLYITGRIGDCSSKVVNRLFGSHLVENSRLISLVSDYAVSVIGKRMGPDTIRNFAEYFNANPSMNGWIFEEWFFSLLCHDDLDLHLKGVILEKLTWPKCSILHRFNFHFFSNEELNICASGAWLRPSNTCQSGYDAVYINKTDGFVRFIQITRSKRHSLHLSHFFDLLKKLGDHFEIRTVEICFVVPMQNLNEFRINCVFGNGLLTPFGWKKGKEKNKIKILGIYGWDNRSLYIQL